MASSSSTLRTLLMAALLSTSISAPRLAAAQGAPAPSTAQAMFDRARELMGQEDFDAACPLLEQSYDIDPAGGTLLNLAVCYEGAERIASAYETFHRALSQAIRDQREDRKAIAEERIAELKPRLSTLRVTLAEGARVEGLTVRVDGAPLAPGALGLDTPYDGGTHVVEATAPGRFDYVARVTLAPAEDTKSVEVPILLERPQTTTTPPFAPVAPPPPAAGASYCAAGFVFDGQGCVVPREPKTLDAGFWTGVGFTTALVGAGAVFGIMAFSAEGEATDFADEACNANACTGLGDIEQAQDAYDRSLVFAWLSTGLFTAGGIVGLFVLRDGLEVAFDDGGTPRQDTGLELQLSPVGTQLIGRF